jgi:class 3 adenylate cyclase
MNEQRASGIATVMFTDVEGSTDITTRLGDDAAASLLGAARGARSLATRHPAAGAQAAGVDSLGALTGPSAPSSDSSTIRTTCPRAGVKP